MSDYKLTMPELLMVYQPEACTGDDLMRLAFYDLIARDALQVYFEYRKPHPRLEQIRYTLVKKGEGWNAFDVRPVHKLYIRQWEANERIQLRFLVYDAYKRAGLFKGFKNKMVHKPLIKAGIFKSYIPIISGLRGTKYELTDKGQEIRKTLQEIIQMGESNLINWMKANAGIAKMYLEKYAPLLLLSSKFDRRAFMRIHWLMSNEQFENAQTDIDADKIHWDIDWALLPENLHLNEMFSAQLALAKDDYFEKGNLETIDTY